MKTSVKNPRLALKKERIMQLNAVSFAGKGQTHTTSFLCDILTTVIEQAV
ncbi:hypothetical protein [Hymenobacter algoricola]|uniref:Uncharacterized protein n=1 Tax=Hymenobacter algoricola TaxID=486267 RepID=A0ABP7MCQ7_9BACT